MDKITIDSEEMMNIIKYPLEISDYVNISVHIVNNGFILDQFTLIWGSVYTYKVYMVHDDDQFNVKIKRIWETSEHYHKHDIIDFSIEDYVKNLTDTIMKVQNNQKDFLNKHLKEAWAIDVFPVMQFMYYVIHKSMNKESIDIESFKRKSKKSYKSATPGNKTFTLIDIIKKYEKHLNKNSSYNRKTKGWNVTGHFRHCASGKVTYIAPYPKGENRVKQSESNRAFKLGG